MDRKAGGVSCEPAASLMAEITARLEDLAAASTTFHTEPADASGLRTQMLDVLKLIDAYSILQTTS